MYVCVYILLLNITPAGKAKEETKAVKVTLMQLEGLLMSCNAQIEALNSRIDELVDENSVLRTNCDRLEVCMFLTYISAI